MQTDVIIAMVTHLENNWHDIAEELRRWVLLLGYTSTSANSLEVATRK